MAMDLRGRFTLERVITPAVPSGLTPTRAAPPPNVLASLTPWLSRWPPLRPNVLLVAVCQAATPERLPHVGNKSYSTPTVRARAIHFAKFGSNCRGVAEECLHGE